MCLFLPSLVSRGLIYHNISLIGLFEYQIHVFRLFCCNKYKKTWYCHNQDNKCNTLTISGGDPNKSQMSKNKINPIRNAQEMPDDDDSFKIPNTNNDPPLDITDRAMSVEE